MIVDEKPASKEDLQKKLDSFGKPDKLTFKAYQYVIFRRANDTIRYIREKMSLEKKAKEGRSCLMKCGSMMKTFMVFAIVAAMVVPGIIETYNKVYKTGNAMSEQEYDTVNMRDGADIDRPEKPADIAKRA